MAILLTALAALPAVALIVGVLLRASPALPNLSDERGSIGAFVPEFWARTLLSSLKKNLVYAAPGVVNRDYEGVINDAGDTVHINSVGRPTIKTYTPGSTSITAEQLTTAAQKLTVDQAKYFAFEVDDVDARQAAGNVMNEGMEEASFALRDVSDQHVESQMRSKAANDEGTVSVAEGSPADAYDNILIPLKTLLDEASVPTERRFCIIPPWLHGRLLRDDRFVSHGTDPNRATLENGMVGAAAGFTIRVSNNAANPSGDDWSVLAGHPMATSYAEQINKTEAYRPENSFSDAVKGLHIYGVKVVRPKALAKALASKT